MDEQQLSGLSPEDQAALAQIMRQKQFAQMLQQRSMQSQPTEYSPGGMAVRQSPLSALVRGAQGYFGSKWQGAADTQQAGLLEKSQAAQQAELEALMADPKGGISRALASRNPRVQAAAAALQKQQQERNKLITEIGAKVNAPAALKNLINDTPGDVGDFPQPEVRTIPNGPNGQPVAVLQNYGEGGRPNASAFPAPAAIVNTGDKAKNAVATALAGKVPEVLEGSSANAQKALVTIQSADRILDLVQKPEVITGFGADPRVAMASLGSFLGFTGPDAAAQTQALMSELAAQTLSNVKKLPGAITEKERPFLELASAGKLSFDPATIARLAHIAKITSHNDLLQSRKQYMGAMSQEGAEAGAAMYPFPRIGGYTIDPKVATEVGTDFWRYNDGPAPGTVPPKPQAAPKTEAEKKARIAELEKQLGLSK